MGTGAVERVESPAQPIHPSPSPSSTGLIARTPHPRIRSWGDWHSWREKGAKTMHQMPETKHHPLPGFIIPELKNRTKASFHTKNLQSRHLELQGAEAQHSARQPCTWLAYSSESSPLTMSPSGSNIVGLSVSLLAFAIICNSILFPLTCLMSVSQPLQTVWSMKAGVSHCCSQHLAHNAWRCLRNLSSIDGRVGGWKDSWRMDKWIPRANKDSEKGMGLVEEVAGESALPKYLPCGTPFTLCILCP